MIRIPTDLSKNLQDLLKDIAENEGITEGTDEKGEPKALTKAEKIEVVVIRILEEGVRRYHRRKNIRKVNSDVRNEVSNIEEFKKGNRPNNPSEEAKER